MSKGCRVCGKLPSPEEMLFTCTYCGKPFCVNHRLPPNHSCSGIAEWMGRAPSLLSARTDIPVSSQRDIEVEVPIRFEPRGPRPVEGRHRPSRRFPYKPFIVICLIAILAFSYVQFPYLWEKPTTIA